MEPGVVGYFEGLKLIKMSRVAENIFEKGVDFQGVKYEIAIKKSNRQTVLSAESLTSESFLSASGVLLTPSLEIAQLFSSAYFKKHNPRVVPAILGLLFLQLVVNISCYRPFVKLIIKCFLRGRTHKKIT
jgi:hypothetical protein